MADQICISTDYLRDLSSKLKALQLDLAGIGGRLAGVELHEVNGGDVRFRCTCRLSDGTGFSAEDIRDAVAALESASRALGAGCQQSAGSVLRAAERFEETEKRITETFLRLDTATGRDNGEAAGAASPLAFGQQPFGVARELGAIRKQDVENIARELEKARERIARKREYEEILRSPDPASNPRIYELIDKRLEDCGFSRRQRALILEKIRGAPADFKDLYIYSFYQYEIVNGSSDGYGGMYKPSNNTLYVDASASRNEEEFIDTFFHETGHAIDGNAGELSVNDPQLIHAIKKDVTDFINGKIDIYGEKLSGDQKNRVLYAFLNAKAEQTSTNETWGSTKAYPPDYLSPEEKRVYKKVAQASYADLRHTDMEDDCMPWDVITGVTNNTITSGGGHRKEYAGDHYWYKSDGTRTGNDCNEAWAEHYSSMMSGDTDSQKTNNDYMPNATARMNEMAEALAKKYRGQ